MPCIRKHTRFELNPRLRWSHRYAQIGVNMCQDIRKLLATGSIAQYAEIEV